MTPNAMLDHWQIERSRIETEIANNKSSLLAPVLAANLAQAITFISYYEAKIAKDEAGPI